jgi:hypothetical protein
MADIKSSIEIALERAAAMGAASRDDVAAEEGRRQGKSLGRRAAVGDLGPADLRAALDRLDAVERTAAVAAAGETLLAELEEGRHQALAAIVALAQGTPAEAPANELTVILGMEGKVEEQLNQELAAELQTQLKALGIGGAAVRPNPLAHPDLERRGGEALARLEIRRQELGLALKQALAG